MIKVNRKRYQPIQAGLLLFQNLHEWKFVTLHQRTVISSWGACWQQNEYEVVGYGGSSSKQQLWPCHHCPIVVNISSLVEYRYVRLYRSQIFLFPFSSPYHLRQDVWILCISKTSKEICESAWKRMNIAQGQKKRNFVFSFGGEC